MITSSAAARNEMKKKLIEEFKMKKIGMNINKIFPEGLLYIYIFSKVIIYYN